MTIILPNLGGSAFLRQGNIARNSIASHFAGASQPPTPWVGMLWWDTSNEELRYCTGISPATFVTVLKIETGILVVKIPALTVGSATVFSGQILSGDSRETPYIFTPEQVATGVRVNLASVADGSGGLYVTGAPPSSPPNGRFLYNSDNQTWQISSNGRFIQLGNLAEGTASLPPPVDQYPGGNVSLLETGTDETPRLWSAKTLKEGIAEIAPATADLVNYTVLVAGTGTEAVGISPKSFRQAIDALLSAGNAKTTAGLSVTEFREKSTTSKLVSGAALNSMLTDASLGLTEEEAKDRDSTKLGLVNGQIFQESISHHSIGDEVSLDRISNGATRVECKTQGRVDFIVNSEVKAYTDRNGFFLADGTAVQFKEEILAYYLFVPAEGGTWPDGVENNERTDIAFNIASRHFNNENRGYKFIVPIDIANTHTVWTVRRQEGGEAIQGQDPHSRGHRGWLINGGTGASPRDRIRLETKSGTATGFWVEAGWGTRHWASFCVWRYQ